MKVIILHPGASWSTADVYAGLRHGLEHHGVTVIQYRLDNRIAWSSYTLRQAWKWAKRDNPQIEEITPAYVYFNAAIGALTMALWHQVDAVIIVSGMYFHPHVATLLKRAGLNVVTLFTESPYDDQELEFAKLIDGCWTNERSAVPAFKRITPHSGYLAHGWHPLIHQPGPQDGDQDVDSHDVVFVGSAFQERIEFLSAIDWDGIDLGLYGNWRALPSRHRLRRYLKGGTVSNARAAALYRRAKIGLNLYRSSKGWGKDAARIAYAESLNPRAYELAACGAFHLSEYRREVEERFGSLVPTFTTAADASALIRAWLADPDGRDRVRAALPSCVSDSSWVARAAQVIGDIQTLLQQAAAA